MAALRFGSGCRGVDTLTEPAEHVAYCEHCDDTVPTREGPGVYCARCGRPVDPSTVRERNDDDDRGGRNV